MQPKKQQKRFYLKAVCFLLLAAVFLVLSFNDLYAFRCGQELVTVGDHKVEVHSKCGEPFYEEITGYTLTKDQEREFTITEWVYKTDRDHFYILTFEGSSLVEIEYIRK